MALGVSPIDHLLRQTADLELRDGTVGIVGLPEAHITFANLARSARGWDRVRSGGLEPGLEETYYYEPPTVTWAYATHVAIVDVDLDAGRVSVSHTTAEPW